MTEAALPANWHGMSAGDVCALVKIASDAAHVGGAAVVADGRRVSSAFKFSNTDPITAADRANGLVECVQHGHRCGCILGRGGGRVGGSGSYSAPRWQEALETGRHRRSSWRRPTSRPSSGAGSRTCNITPVASALAAVNRGWGRWRPRVTACGQDLIPSRRAARSAASTPASWRSSSNPSMTAIAVSASVRRCSGGPSMKSEVQVIHPFTSCGTSVR